MSSLRTTTCDALIVPSGLYVCQEREENMELLARLERQCRTNLSSDVRLMNDLAATKKLAELKKQYDETMER